MLRVRALSKSFGGVEANKDIDLELAEGAIRCVVGPNGAGKSTLVSMLSGHTTPDSGRIEFKGRDITGWSVHKTAKAGILRKFQRPSFYPELTVAENLEIAVLAAGLRRRAAQSAIQRVAEQTRLGEVLADKAAVLPHGRMQWLEIGLLLARRARLMLLDEPAAGMTPEETAATSALIAELVNGSGVSAIVIEHNMGFVRSLNSDVTVLHLGRVLAEGPMSEIEKNATVQAIYLGDEVS